MRRAASRERVCGAASLVTPSPAAPPATRPPPPLPPWAAMVDARSALARALGAVFALASAGYYADLPGACVGSAH